MNFSIIISSILSGDKDFGKIRETGRDISIAYQIQDDFKDFKKETDKRKISRKQSQRLVDLVGNNEAEKIKKRLLYRALKNLRTLPNSEKVEKFVEKIFSKKYF